MATRSGPCEVTITAIGGGGSPIVIPREAQLEDAVINIERLNLEHRTQESAAPIDYRKTGINAGLALSIADMDSYNYLALAFSAEEQEEAGALPTDPVKRRIDLSDDAGLEFFKFELVIKPYEGASPTTDANKWWTFTNACAVNPDAFETTFGLETQQSFNLRFMALPDPDTRIKVIIGDKTLV